VAKLRPPIWGIAPDHWRTYLALRRYDRIERSQATRADVVASPSQALATMMQRRWRLNRLTTLAYPFRPSSELLSTPANTNHRTVLFIGRLERRKGVLELAAAIPQVLSDHPDVVFRFVGPSDVSPERGVTMRDYLGALLAPHSDSVAIEDPVPMAGVPQLMRAADLVVLPSRWENFPYACLEAMSAARGIVASRAGGMREQLDDGSVGCLVNPDDPHGIAVAISQLMDDPDRRISLGEAARRRVLGHYGYDALVPSYEDVYRQAIARRRGLVADAS
jgi:glycosyltransferase involved in cell wall biosynthesis